MPILPAEPELYPPELFDEPPVPDPDRASPPDEADPDDPPRWWCLHARPRQEKAAARHLRELRLPHYLPLAAKESRTPGGRKIRSVIPLFPGYLFFRGSRAQRLEALRGGHLVGTLEVEDQGQLERDLRQIHRMLASGTPVVPEPDFPVGSRVRITQGNLAGLVGVVVRRGNSDHFVAVVHLLGKGVSMELEPWQVEPAGDENGAD